MLPFHTSENIRKQQIFDVFKEHKSEYWAEMG